MLKKCAALGLVFAAYLLVLNDAVAKGLEGAFPPPPNMVDSAQALTGIGGPGGPVSQVEQTASSLNPMGARGLRRTNLRP
jgi:hypothetical protein